MSPTHFAAPDAAAIFAVTEKTRPELSALALQARTSEQAFNTLWRRLSDGEFSWARNEAWAAAGDKDRKRRDAHDIEAGLSGAMWELWKYRARFTGGDYCAFAVTSIRRSVWRELNRRDLLRAFNPEANVSKHDIRRIQRRSSTPQCSSTPKRLAA